MRRHRGFRVRRGQAFPVVAAPVTPPAFPPPFIRQAGGVRRNPPLLYVRRRPPRAGFGQAGRGQAWPSFIRQPAPRQRYPVRMVRSGGRFLAAPQQAPVTSGAAPAGSFLFFP